MIWQLTAKTSALTSGIVHVWAANLNLSELQLVLLSSWLAQDELTRAERFKFPVHQRRFIASRGCLRYLLSRYLNCLPQEVQLSYGEHGKPYLVDNDLQFNNSDSEDLALFAFGLKYPVGIDVEYYKSDVKIVELAQRFFAADEAQALQALPIDQQLPGFYRVWTCKEAFIKALGMGLSFPLSKFGVDVDPQKPAQLRHIDADSVAAQQWQLLTFTPKPNFAAALAVQTPTLTVTVEKFWLDEKAAFL